MYDGKQVLRFVNNYKTKDLYLIGNEMNKRIGTGNYDSERTKFNVHYKDISKSNLYQEVKSILEDRNIEYSHKTKTNILITESTVRLGDLCELLAEKNIGGVPVVDDDQLVGIVTERDILNTVLKE